MASQNQRKNRIENLKQLGILSKKSSLKRDDDIEKYLKQKVEKDEIVLIRLIRKFKDENPHTTVSFPVNFQHH